MNGFGFFVFAATIFCAAFIIPRVIAHDKLLAELEGLDDEPLAAEAALAWERGDWS